MEPLGPFIGFFRRSHLDLQSRFYVGSERPHVCYKVVYHGRSPPTLHTQAFPLFQPPFDLILGDPDFAGRSELKIGHDFTDLREQLLFQRQIASTMLL
jgi:hypothetical protein